MEKKHGNMYVSMYFFPFSAHLYHPLHQKSISEHIPEARLAQPRPFTSSLLCLWISFTSLHLL